MARISNILRSVGTDSVGFWCPGCKGMHVVRVSGNNAWTWNQDVNNPTFSPSLLIASGCKSSLYTAGDPCWCTYNRDNPDKEKSFECSICHSFIRDGNIEFLNDCTHELSGKTVRISDLPEHSV